MITSQTRGAEFTRKTEEYLQGIKAKPYTKTKVIERGQEKEIFVPRVPTIDGLCVFLKTTANELEIAKRDGTPALKRAIEFAETQINAVIQEMTLNKQLDRSAGIFIMKAKHGMREEDKNAKTSKNTFEIVFKDKTVEKMMK